jgi:hypothetical protein
VRILLTRWRERRGQTLVETALVLPLFIATISAILTFGIWIFYEQQIATVAREAARYAAVHSASADCPVGGWLAPAPGTIPKFAGAWNCDSASAGWPNMTARAREFAFGMDPTQVRVSACWAGYHDLSNPATYDAGPIWANDPVTPNPWFDCTMNGGTNPITETSSLPCPANTAAPSAPGLLDGDDQASNLAVSDRELAVAANRVVVYACYNWSPPLAGFLGIPQTVVLRAVFSEGLQHQR